MEAKNSLLELRDVPESLRTEKVCTSALAKDFAASIMYVPTEIITDAFLSKRIRSEKKAIEIVGNRSAAFLKYIPESVKTRKVCEAAISAAAENFEFVPVDLLDEEFLMSMVSLNGEALEFLPEPLKTESICRIAFAENINALDHFPESFVTEEDCRRYITEGWSISAIPRKLLTPALLAYGVRSKSHRKDRYFYKNAIPRSLKSVDLMMEMVKLDARYLYRMWDDWEDLGLLSDDSLLKLVKTNGYCIEGIAKAGALSDDLCIAALETEYKRLPDRNYASSAILKHFPKSLVDEEIARMAIGIDPHNLEYVPSSLKTESMVDAAIQCSKDSLPDIFKHIPGKLLTDERCIHGIKSNIQVFRVIPDNAKTASICREALTIARHDIVDAVPAGILVPEYLMYCPKAKYPGVKKFAQLMSEWVEGKAVEKAEFAAILSNASGAVKKSSEWQKYAVTYL